MLIKIFKNETNSFFFIPCVLSFFWIFLCQIVFLNIQSNQAHSTSKLIESQFREELKASNFLYLSRAISDLDQNKVISCSVLNRIEDNEKRLILDLRYLNECETGFFTSYGLNGKEVEKSVRAINGDLYEIKFRSVNGTTFYLSIWIARLSGVIILILVFMFIDLQKKHFAIMHENEMKIERAKVDMARQVGHDMRSPIAAINLIFKKIVENESEEFSVFKSATERMNQISTDLLNMSAQREIKNQNEHVRFELIVCSIKDIFEEKKIIYLENQKKMIHFKLDIEDVSSREDFIIDLNIADFKRVLSNLLNNSIEASRESNAEIVLSLRCYINDLLINISDNGCGISEQDMSKLGEKGFTSGKVGSGNGLGLFHAKKTVIEWGGRFSIQSKVGNGTIVQMTIPILKQI